MTLPIPEKVKKISSILESAGASDIFLVGGCVRDLFSGYASKDYDLEVYGISYNKMADALRCHFKVSEVGQSFRVLKVGNDVDLAIPRRESKTGVGHCAFMVTDDPKMTFQEAASRRDFTINAIGMRADGSVCDPFSGIEDLKRGILRAPTEAFCEDPLRVLRAMQFAARFRLKMDSHTIELCQRVLPEFSSLSAERIYEEWSKWAIKGIAPEIGLDILKETHWITCFPELNSLLLHDSEAFPNLRTRCARMRKIITEYQLDSFHSAVLMFAMLGCNFIPPGNITEFLRNMKAPYYLLKLVEPLVRHVHDAVIFPCSESAVRRLAVLIKPANIKLWYLLCMAYGIPDSTLLPWKEKAILLGIYEKHPEKILYGKHLLKLGVPPGCHMGEILNRAWEAQLDGAFNDLDGALLWVNEHL